MLYLAETCLWGGATVIIFGNYLPKSSRLISSRGRHGFFTSSNVQERGLYFKNLFKCKQIATHQLDPTPCGKLDNIFLAKPIPKFPCNRRIRRQGSIVAPSSSRTRLSSAASVEEEGSVGSSTSAGKVEQNMQAALEGCLRRLHIDHGIPYSKTDSCLPRLRDGVVCRFFVGLAPENQLQLINEWSKSS